MSKEKIYKNIGPILQATKETVNKNHKYFDYIINQNNSLYMRQLPLLIKNYRINSLILSKTKKDLLINNSMQNNIHRINNGNEETKNKNNILPFPISYIRNKKIRSQKLPPLCPFFNEKGQLDSSIVKSSKILIKRMICNNSMKSICSMGKFESARNIFYNTKSLKKLKNNNSCDFEIKLGYNKSENKFFNEPEYDNLKYDESKIFGQKKLYKEIIKQKINELRNPHNKDNTSRFEKVYKYGLEKLNMYLSLDSLKISIYEVKNEKSENLEIFEKPVFEYFLPFSLLPLFYFKGVNQFLIILSKLIIYNEINGTFEYVKNDDEIIEKILKNCNDFSSVNFEDENIKIIDQNEQNNNDMNINNDNTTTYEIDKKNNKNNASNNSFINNSQNNSTLYRNSTIFQNSLESNDNNIENSQNINNINISQNANRVGFSETFYNTKKNVRIQKIDIYSTKSNNDNISFSSYEYFWITSKKSYILNIEKPLITVSVPSQKNVAKKYINYELLFYLYHTQFVMWDFYIIKYLSTFKNFRIFLKQINSIPGKRNLSFYITNPKIKKNIFTFYELISIVTHENFAFSKGRSDLTRETVKNKFKKQNSVINLKNMSNSPKRKKHQTIRLKKGNEEEINKLLFPNQPTNNISNKNDNSFMINSIFIQKGLLVVASFINKIKGITNEFTFHFNLDQLRKFQKMEVLMDKLSFFVKFMKINYEKESIFFDFDSFRDFNENTWIRNMNKYNFKDLENYKTIYEEKKLEYNSNTSDVSMMKIYRGYNKNINIKIEIKYPLILMKGLDDNGFKITEEINVDNKIENLLTKIKINNSLDLTKQVIGILKDNNFYRKKYNYDSKRNTRKKTTNKQKRNTVREYLMNNQN